MSSYESMSSLQIYKFKRQDNILDGQVGQRELNKLSTVSWPEERKRAYSERMKPVRTQRKPILAIKR